MMDIDRLQEIKETPLDADEAEEAVEQAIERAEAEREDFSEELPEWDGTDSAMVPDSDAAEFEEQLSGIRISYQLTKQEIKTVLRSSRIFRYSRRKMVIQTILLGLLLVFFLLSYLTATSPRPEQLTIAIVSAVMIGLVWGVPEYRLDALAKRQRSDIVVEAEIFPDIIKMGKDEGYWEVPLDGSSQFQETGGLLIITTPNKKCAAFPIRSIEPALLSDIIAMLAAGTDQEV